MGKRKERRLAAKAAGRRVKLDIFAEPPGESGGSSAQDELGGDIDPRHRAGSADSPSSSGKLENPLSLLGQYSDEESDEDSSRRLGDADNSSHVDGDQVRQVEEAENDHMKSKATDIDADKEKQDILQKDSGLPDALHTVGNIDDSAIDSAVSGDLFNEVTVETNVGATDLQTSGDEFSCWKVVLHEESNQHYYWNTLTGETSWVVPDVLAQGNELTAEHDTIPLTEEGNIVLEGKNLPISPLNVEDNISNTIHATEDGTSGNVLHGTQEISEPVSQAEQDDRSRDEGLDSPGKLTAVKESYCAGELYLDNVSSLESAGALLGNSNANGADTEKYNEEHGTDIDLCSSALKYGESLMERLKSLRGSKTDIEGADWLHECILEVDIRLSDIKSLLPFGSSLLPFWVHCERKLKELDEALDIKVSQFNTTTEKCEMEELHKLQDLEEGEIEVDGAGTDKICATLHASASAVTSTFVQEFSKNEDISTGVLHDHNVSEFGNVAAQSVSGCGDDSEVCEAQQPTESTVDAVAHAAEDVDMDVDMEVEEQVLTSATITNNTVGAEERPPPPNPSPESGYFIPPESFGVPPPTDDYFIPPPPPDDELVPPLPPDDPPELSYPPQPAYSETLQSLAYAEGYNLTYAGCTFDYYGQANPVYSANNVYGNGEGCQVAGSAPPLYGESLPSMYPVAAPVTINPVEPSAYYSTQNGVLFPEPVASSSQSFVLPVGSAHEVVANHIRSVESHTEVCVPATLVTEKPSTVGSTQPPPSVSELSAKESVWSSSTSGVDSGPPISKSTGANVQPKVSRGKKRTVAGLTLKSNKKVSSLVNKWKAVKEEMHEEDEDEPENDYEFLEKKRQREIEEWRAKQIASGEAKDNANFQPLGGDWRERVKRKRARMNKEPEETSPATSTDANQQPDLKEFSRDLPSGWQAFWDESSKQVYYGNTQTSETTWTRPAK